ncbi:hypothetical protein [Bordetella holmesii]|uniref:Exported protein n=2 Tax=Bordetella holmesii TaxID=35814 RepID=A0ABP3BEV3_9BORD|nr:hypothetical protein [Bordetella holmesii]AHV94672.1 putative exported protein [Bordetella holmesii ATCC 51541]AIT27683.1 putative exported protein [Bordetella holmesii 44057]EWM43055.1 putative exported protein [Bordetella holmesii 41130]EWM49261.1 putative exported protein [Bordetella holmesii 70147]AMD46479.1 hypothetical protein H558_13795 [Bordetella holmesii H558]
MTLRIAFIVALAAPLAACVTAQNIRSLDPLFYGSTQRSAQQYTECVSAAWKGMGVNFTQQPLRDGLELVVDGSLGVEAVLSASTYRGKTDVKLASRLPQRSQPLVESANLCL